MSRTTNFVAVVMLLLAWPGQVAAQQLNPPPFDFDRWARFVVPGMHVPGFVPRR
jgi:hypothetical protein